MSSDLVSLDDEQRVARAPLNDELRNIRTQAYAENIAEEHLVGLTASRARGLAADGRFPAKKVGRAWMVRPSDRLRIAHALGVPLGAVAVAAE